MALFVGLSIVRFGSTRMARRLGDGRHRPLRGGRGLRARPRQRPLAPGPLPPADAPVDPARGHRRPRRDPAPGGRGLHHALPAQAAQRQPALPAPALLVPGGLDPDLADRRSAPSSSGSARRGYNARYMLVVGANPAAKAFADSVEGHVELGLRPIGYLAGPNDPAAVRRAGTCGDRSSGPWTRSRTSCTEPSSTRWRSASASRTGPLVEPITRLCEDEGRIVRIPLTETTMIIPGGRIEDFHGDADPVAGLRTGSDPRDRHQAPARHRHRDGRADRPQPSAAHPRSADLAAGRPADPLPPGAGRPPRAPVPCRQVPDDGPRRRGSPDRARGGQRDPGPRLQDDRRPAPQPVRALAAPDEPRRAAAAVERRCAAR